MIDSENFAERHPLVWVARRWLGPKWAIAASVLQRAKHYDVILATGEDVGIPLTMLMAASRVRVPLIIICHNMIAKRPSVALGKLQLHKAGHIFLCMSPAQVELLHQRYGISKSQLHFIHWHVDHRFFHPMPNVPVKNQICSAGMASRDYATLIEATRGLPVEVKIAADSAWYQQSLNFSPERLHPQVEVQSAGDYVGLRQLYAESQFVVLPLESVPFAAGYSVKLEAMAMGKALITTRMEQPLGAIRDGWNGFVVEPGNVEEMRQCIQYLLNHPEEARIMGANARKTIENMYTLDHFQNRVLHIIQHVMQRRSTEGNTTR
ncbi:MAG: glycosyltransferase family 4 protein [Chloroflexaceae bacterium]|nr:glycosyltransferase family 4 protein [Chloroflexaceae bacterium]